MPTLLFRTLCGIAFILTSITAHGDDYGRTRGSFGVSPNGSATYAIPIWTPPGPNGMGPSIALNYDSQSGNGLAGVGWNLSAVSSIERCARTFGQDGAGGEIALSLNDRFCLGGNRLRLYSGTYGQTGSIYFTEIADYARITAGGTLGNGPDHFIVEGKDGLIYEYGNIANARVVLGGSVLRWMLNKVYDRNGNNYLISYNNNGTGFAVPDVISWTPTSLGASTYAYEAKFNYLNTRIDTDSYAAKIQGLDVVNHYRLESIDIKSASVIKRHYVLGYDTSPGASRSRLVSLKECIDAPAVDCFLPITFQYQAGQGGVTLGASAPPAGSSTNLIKGRYDLNGDGKDDVVYWSGSTWYALLSTNGGFAGPYSTGATAANVMIDKFLPNGRDALLTIVGGTIWTYRWDDSIVGFASNNTGVTSAMPAAAVDFNGDALADLVYFTSGVTSLQLRTNISTGSGAASFSASAFSTAALPANKIYGAISVYPGKGLHRIDVNGDGRQDLGALIISTGMGGGGQNSTVLLGSSSGLDLPPQASWTTGSTFIFPVVNFNSDRCTDRIVGATVLVSACSGVAASTVALPGTPQAFLDWNGDGKTDLLVDNGGTFGVYLSTGTGFSSLITTSLSSTGTFFDLDQDGDGMDDLIRVNGTSPFSYWTHTAGGSVPTFATNIPDLLSSVTDGFGVISTPSYVSTAWSNYDKGATTGYPLVELDGGKTVVSQVSTSDGNGGSFNKQYYYVGARGNALRGDFAGFQRVDETDNRNGLIDRRYFEQSFPLGGLISQHEFMQSNGVTPISRTVYTNSFTALDSTANNQRYYRFNPSSTSTKYEVGGTWNAALLRTVVATNFFDTTTGTQYRQKIDVSEPAAGANGALAGGSWTFDTLSWPLTADTTNWCLGRPLKVQQANLSNLTFGASITRTRDLTWDVGKCRPTKIVDESGSGTLQVTTDLAYDSFGNTSSTTVTGTGMEPRISTALYSDATHTTGQFPLSVTQSVSSTFNQTSSFVWNYDLGVPTSATDPNNLVTSRQYDPYGRLIREDRPDTTYATWIYSSCPTCDSRVRLSVDNKVQTAGGTTYDRSIAYLDQFDRSIFERQLRLDGGFNMTRRNFDALGRVANEYFPFNDAGADNGFSTIAYDLIDRPISVSRPISDSIPTAQATNIFYEGLTTRIGDAQSKYSYQVVSAIGLLTRSKDNDGNFQGFDYDVFGNLKRIFDTAGNNLQSSTYDLRGGLTQRVDLDMGTWNFTPDALGETASQVDAKGQLVSFTFDRLGRLTTRTEPEGTSTWTWGVSSAAKNIGQLSRVAGPGYSEDYTYDSLGRLSNTKVTSDAIYQIDLSYNSMGAPDTLTYPTSTSSYRLKLQYGYQNGQLATIKDFNAPSTIFWSAGAANAQDQITQETLGVTPATPNGIVTNRAFDAVTGWLKTIKTGPGGGTAVQDLAYAWDLVGNLSSRKDANQSNLTETFVYDNLYRVQSSSLNTTGTNLTMAYDALGNITSKSDVGSYTYNATKKHQLSSTSNGWSFGYDNNGNMTSGRGATITWTSYNYPLSISNGADTSSFSYTPDRQYWKQVANYTSGGAATTIYAGGLLEKVTTSAGTDYRHIIRAGGSTIVVSRQSAGTNSVYYLTGDSLGSSSAILNSSGGILVNSSFDAFGRRRGSNWSGSPSSGDWAAIAGTTRQGFTSQTMLDNLNLTHMNGRVYDQMLGRFISADPFITEPLNSQNYNRYSYVLNNPLSAIDPSGFDKEKPRPYRPDAPGFQPFSVHCDAHGALCDGDGGWGSRDCLSYACTYPTAQIGLGEAIAQAMAEQHRNDGPTGTPPAPGVTSPSPGMPTTMPGDSKPTDSVGSWSGNSPVTYRQGEFECNQEGCLRKSDGRFSPNSNDGIQPASLLDPLVLPIAAAAEKLGCEGACQKLVWLGIAVATRSPTAAKGASAAESTLIRTSPRNLIPTQTRAEMSGSQIKRFTKDMKQNGFDQSQPVDAWRNPLGRLEIQDGHHRTEAAIRAGIDEIPVRVWP